MKDLSTDFFLMIRIASFTVFTSLVIRPELFYLQMSSTNTNLGVSLIINDNHFNDKIFHLFLYPSDGMGF